MRNIVVIIGFCIFLPACFSMENHDGWAFINDEPVIIKEKIKTWSLNCLETIAYEKMSPEEIQLEKDNHQVIREAFEFWNRVLGYDLFQESEDCGSGELLVYPNAAWINPHKLAGYTHFDYWHGNKAFEILLSSEWHTGSETFPWISKIKVIRHEVGHVLGLDHIYEENCIMNPSTYSGQNYPCPSEEEKLLSHYPLQ